MILMDEIKELLTVSFKARLDPLTDLYSRLFMVKLLMACTIVTGLNWFTDSVHCLDSLADSEDTFSDFASKTCWIQGLYVYREMTNRINESGYYGIPRNLEFDGIYTTKKGKTEICPTKSKFNFISTFCKPMEKTFFLQYQWMPFFLAALALIYYVPYMFYKEVNKDLVRLGQECEKDEADVKSDLIVKSYFPNIRKKKGRITRLSWVQLQNLVIKVAYLVVNVLIFYATNSVLNGQFSKYGMEWLDWNEQPNAKAYDYMGAQSRPRPGNHLLPPFGFCELYTQAKDLRTDYSNKHTVLCELSPHILYQYVFLLLWFAMIVGIVVSVVGIIVLLIDTIFGLIGIRTQKRNNSDISKLFDSLHFRQVEYLEYMRKHAPIVYGDVLAKLRHRTLTAPPPSSTDSGSIGSQPSTKDGMELKKRQPRV